MKKKLMMIGFTDKMVNSDGFKNASQGWALMRAQSCLAALTKLDDFRADRIIINLNGKEVLFDSLKPMLEVLRSRNGEKFFKGCLLYTSDAADE